MNVEHSVIFKYDKIGNKVKNIIIKKSKDKNTKHIHYNDDNKDKI